MLTSIGNVGTFCWVLGMCFSFGSISKQNKKSTAVFILGRICATVNLNCCTKSYAFQNECGITLF